MSLAQRLIRFVLLALVITTIIAALIAALFCVLNVCATIGSGLPVERLARLPLAVVQFFALSWCCCALVMFPVSLHWCLFGQTRKIWVEGKQLRTQIGDRQATLDLEECTWSVWRGPYLGPARPRLSVNQNNRTVELGFTEEAAARWTAYFEAIGVYRTPSVHWPRFMLAITIAGVVGGTVGCLLEPLMPLIGGPANPQGRLMFLGVLDGVMVILYRLAIRNGQFGRMGRLSGTWVMMVLLGGFAFKMWGTVMGDRRHQFGDRCDARVVLISSGREKKRSGSKEDIADGKQDGGFLMSSPARGMLPRHERAHQAGSQQKEPRPLFALRYDKERPADG